MTAAATTPTTALRPQGVLEHLDPHSLALEDNVRDGATNSQGYADLVASIGQYGVLSALSGVRSAQGVVTVRDGQRRLLAAREAGLVSVPVYVTADSADSERERTVARITEQIVANDHRAALTQTQRAKGIQQLLLEGLTPAKVAKSLTVPKTLVEAAATATGSEQAMAALSGTTQLSIAQAAVLAEFDDNDEAVRYLVEAASDGQFDHRVAELRHKAAAAAARESALTPWRDKGHRILDERPGWSSELMATKLDRLCDAQGDTISAELAEQCPQVWAVWLEEVEIYIDTRTGEEIDEGDVDWDIDASDHDATAEEGYVHPRFIAQRNIFEPDFFCLDIDAAGVLTRSQYYQRAHHGGTGAGSQDAEERKEVERREKRKVVALNKLGHAAIEVRRAWVKDRLLARKTPPQGAALFIAGQLCEHPHLLSAPSAASTAAELLGITAPDTTAARIAGLPHTGDPRAIVLTLGLVLGALEAETPKDAWRRRYTSYSKDYLIFLSENGYELSDIEKVITGKVKADTLYTKIAAAAAKSPKAG